MSTRVWIADTWGAKYTPLGRAAELLGVHPDTVRAWVESGRLRSRKMRDVWVYVDFEDLVAVAAERGVDLTPYVREARHYEEVAP